MLVKHSCGWPLLRPAPRSSTHSTHQRNREPLRRARSTVAAKVPTPVSCTVSQCSGPSNNRRPWWSVTTCLLLLLRWFCYRCLEHGSKSACRFASSGDVFLKLLFSFGERIASEAAIAPLLRIQWALAAIAGIVLQQQLPACGAHATDAQVSWCGASEPPTTAPLNHSPVRRSICATQSAPPVVFGA